MQGSFYHLSQWVIFLYPLQSTPMYHSSISQVQSWPRQVFLGICKVFKLPVWRVLYRMVSAKLTECLVSRFPRYHSHICQDYWFQWKPERNWKERPDLWAVFRSTKGTRSLAWFHSTCSSQIPFDVFPGCVGAVRCVRRSSEAMH